MMVRDARAPLATHVVVAALLLSPFAVVFWHSLSGDATVYFTFIERFFQKPFSYQAQTVSFGATSPLHVMIHAPLFQLLGRDHWLSASRAVNLLFVAAGVGLLTHAVGGRLSIVPLACLLAALNTDLFVTSAQFFETGLAFLMVAALYTAMTCGRLMRAAALCGLLYLVRPELILVGAAVEMLVLLRLEAAEAPRTRQVVAVAMLLAPVVLYHLYMWRMVGTWVPSSVYARALTSLETTAPWSARFATSVRAATDAAGAFYAISIAAVGLAIVGGRARDYALELAMLTSVVVYVAVPPLGYTNRYLLPLAPVLIAVVLRVSAALGRAATTGASVARTRVLATSVSVVALGGLAATAAAAAPYAAHPRYDYDTLLLKDLADVLNPMTSPRDAVLIYEIQAQYYLHARCLSLDGIVGGQLLDALAGKESFEQFIEAHPEVRYVVTANAFNTRKIYEGTLLADLYAHDQRSDLDTVLASRGLRFRKIATNPVFSRPEYYREVRPAWLNTPFPIRVYGPWNPLWVEHSPLWNSVYRIER